MPTFVLQIHRSSALPQRSVVGAAPHRATAAATLDLTVGREALPGAAVGDHVASTLRDLCAAALSLLEGRASKALVPLYDTPWELCLVAGDARFELSLYRTGALPEVRVLDETVTPEELATQLRAATLALRGLRSEAECAELAAMVDRLGAPEHRPLRADRGASTMIRWRSRQRFAADGSGAASIVAVTLQAVLSTRETGARSETAQADLHALLSRGRLGFEVRGQRIDLGAGFVFLQFERLVALCRPLLEARAARRAMNVRAHVGGATLGLRLGADEALALTITRPEGTITVPALDPRAFVAPVAEGALALAAATVRCDRGLARNLRLRALRGEARALRRWLRDLDRVDTKLNDDPARYRSVVTEAVAERATLDLRGASRLRYAQRWRAEVEGLDLPGTFLSGDRLIVPGARELCAIERSTGNIAWTAPASRAATVAAGDDILRVSARGDVELRSAENGEALWTTRVVPRVGPSSPPVVIAQPGVARVALLTESERRLVALDLRTGEARWTLNARHGGSFRIRRCGRLAVIVSGDAVVTAADLATGEVVWRHGDGVPFSAAPTVRAETFVALAGEPGRGPAVAHVLGGLTGAHQHTLRAEIAACAPPTANGDTVVIPCASREAGVVLVGFSLSTGRELFRTALDATVAGAGRPATVAVDDLFVTNLPSGRAVAVDARSGEVRWTWSGRASRPEDVPRRLDPVVRGGAIFLPQASLAVLRPRDGVAIADVDCCDLVPDLLRVDDAGAVYVGEESGHLGCFELGARLRVLRPV